MVAAEPGVSDRAYTIASPPHDPHSSPSARQPHTHPSPTQAICSGQASDQGNTIYAIPYALRPVHGPPYPELSIVLIPNILREARTAPHRTAPHRTRRTAPPHRLGAQNIHKNCSIDPQAGALECNCDRFISMGGEMIGDLCRDFSYEKLEPIRFTVQVRGCSVHAHAHAHAHARRVVSFL